jgi:hypothetical protein
VSGRHSKPLFHSLFHQATAAELKTVGGVVAGAAIAGAIAASAAVTTPNTAPATATPTAAAHLAYQRTLADVGVVRAEDPSMSRHEAHRRHVAHVKHMAHVAAHPDKAGESRSRSDKATTGKSEKSLQSSRSSKLRPAGAKRVTAKQVIALAKDQIGIREGRSGRTKFNRWAVRTIKRDGGSGAAYRSAPWCDMFVSWVGDKLGISDTMGIDVWTVRHAKWFKKRDRWGHRPRPGAVTFFSWDGNKIRDIEHVGFTIKDNRDGTIQTVEGNTDDKVAIRKRPKSSVVGYGYPEYKK